MTPELQAFIDHFNDEAELRSAIEGLLTRREECQSVRNLHGKDEHGKDLVFHAPAGLGRPKLNACVIKLEKITGSASDATSGARNVLIQCDQALDTPVVNTQGQEEWVSHVYVMCPNELSPTAIQSVAGAFKGKPSQIEFVCGHDFLQMFKQCWPDFIFFQPDLLSAHLETLAKELESDSNIQKLATAHGLSTLAQNKNIYVEPSLSQVRGKLSRGAALPERSFLSKMSSPREIQELRNVVDVIETSLQIVEYLPPSYQKKRGRAVGELQGWPDRFNKEWSDEYNRVSSETFKRDRHAPVPTVPIPQRAVEEFFKSGGYRFVAEVYGELDRQIDDANTWVALANRTELPGSESFANYGSLLHASTIYFPTIEFASDSLVEWSAEELLSNTRNTLVTGAPGFGKTSFCRNHFLADLESFRTGQSQIVPLYFVAHSLVISEGQSFEDVFIRREVAGRLASDPSLKVRLYLDGLDEVRSKEDRDRILLTVRQPCTSENSRYHCIATARDHVGGYWTSWLVRVRLSAMSSEKLRELVTAWLDGDTMMIARFYAELTNSESLIPVLGVPLLATLTVLVFKNLHRLPENRLRLYQMFIDLLLGGWNLAKGLQRAYVFSPTVKLLVLTRLAGTMHAQRLNDCTDSVVLSTLKQVVPALAPKLRAVVSELVEDGLLLHTGTRGYTFPHLSFQEYLAAKDAIDPSRGEEERRVVQAYLAGDDWYKEVANFIVSMTTNPIGMRGWVVDLVKKFATPHALSDSEKRAGYLLTKLTEAFPESKPSRSSATVN
jgi:hypothetical protein